MLNLFSKRLITIALSVYALCTLFSSSCFTFAKTVKVLPAETRAEYVNIAWWERFNDEFLIKYIICALNNNYDLKNARLKIENLRQARNIEISKQFPSVSVGADYLGLKIPRVAFPFQGFRDNAFALPFIVNWELDLFGKRKNKIDMAEEDYNEAVYDEKWASIALAGEIGGLYFNIANLNEQINIQNEIIKNKEEKLRRVEKAYNAGVLGASDLNASSKELEYEKTVLNGYKKQREGFLNDLIYLMGEAPEALVSEDARGYEFKEISALEFGGEIPECISSDVTYARPDVLQKEAHLKKAKIDITLARKEFLPNVNVFGVLVFSTLTPNFGWKGASANLLAGATENLFSGGRRIFNLKSKKLAYDSALNDYLKADLNALKEINDALYYLKTDNATYMANLRSLDFEEDNFIRVSNSFRSGVSGRLDVIDKRNNFLYEKSKVLNSKVQKFADWVSLYKAVGGHL